MPVECRVVEISRHSRNRDVDQLVSLLTMLRFYAISYAVAHGNLERAECIIRQSGPLADPDGPIPDEKVALVERAISDMEKACKELPVSHSLQAQVLRLKKRLAADHLGSDQHRMIAISLIQELRDNVCAELSSHYYLLIPAERRHLYEQRKPIHSESFANRFPDAVRDYADAGRCVALDQWTAAIFHLMRVLEHGLRDLAIRVGATFNAPIELENWKNIIDVIEKKIRELEQQPKSAQKSEDLQFYGKAASQFWYVKEAWRNHVSHSRATYDERDALQVFNAVSDFMRLLASRP